MSLAGHCPSSWGNKKRGYDPCVIIEEILREGGTVHHYMSGLGLPSLLSQTHLICLSSRA